MPVSDDVELFLREQMGGRLRTRRMFGGYGVYLGEKTVAFLLQDALFLRPLPELEAFFRATLDDLPPRDAPVRSAQPYWRIDPDLWEDAEWLADLLNLMYDILPAPKPRRPPKSARRTGSARQP